MIDKAEFFLISYYFGGISNSGFGCSTWNTLCDDNKPSFLDINAFENYIKKQCGGLEVVIISINRITRDEYLLYTKKRGN